MSAFPAVVSECLERIYIPTARASLALHTDIPSSESMYKMFSILNFENRRILLQATLNNRPINKALSRTRSSTKLNNDNE